MKRVCYCSDKDSFYALEFPGFMIMMKNIQDTCKRVMDYHKNNGVKNRDYISNLPDDVISRILSCLPTKYAVRTSVLSKAWEYKWTSIYAIDICDGGEYVGSREKLIFANFVERVLSHTQNVRRFHLVSSNEYGETRVRGWLSAVFRRNVEKVSISIRVYSGDILPRSLLSCTSLRKLDLWASCTWKTPVNTYFPNLKRLHLLQVEITNDNSSTDTLAFHFPVLETFSIRLHRWLNVSFVEIYAPKLISFISETTYGEDIGAHIVKILGASFHEFEICGGYPENFLLTGSTVSSAALRNDDDDIFDVKSGLQVRKLLNEFSSLNHLELTCYLVQGIVLTKSVLPLSKFDELETLVLSSPGVWNPFSNSKKQFEGLFELLHSAPLLKSLSFDMFAGHCMESRDDNNYDYDVMESVPSCVAKHLVEVKFESFKCEIPHLRLAMFFLKNGAELKNFSVWCDDSEKVEIEELLSKFPKASKGLAIVVLEEHNTFTFLP